MKKMNLKFFGRGAKMVLPLFLLIGLFMVSATTVSAQFVPKEEAKAKLDVFIQELPESPDMFPGMDYSAPKYQKVATDILRRDFSKMLNYQLGVDATVSQAIESTYARMTARIPASKMDPIKQEIEALLSE